MANRTWGVAFSTALAAKLIINTTGGKLRSISGRIDATASTGTYFLQLWDAADVPADATATTFALGALMAPYKIAHTSGTDDRFALDFAEGILSRNGFTLGLSTTEFTKTAAGAFLSATAEIG